MKTTIVESIYVMVYGSNTSSAQHQCVAAAISEWLSLVPDAQHKTTSYLAYLWTTDVLAGFVDDGMSTPPMSNQTYRWHCV